MGSRLLAVIAFGLLYAAAPLPALAISGSDEISLIEVEEHILDGDYQESLNLLINYVQGSPEAPEGYNLMGYSFRKLGHFKQAQRAYNRALQLDQNHIGANEYLGELYLQTDRLPEAEAQLEIVRLLCGDEDCTAYTVLAESVAEFKAK
ncbi:MAG: tetratricopeptide repeat protein [Alphaproteobacteria bacterium]|jgi:Flp pilus assembly protein TadD